MSDYYDSDRSQPAGDEYVAFESVATAGKEPFLRINAAGGGSGTSSIVGVSISGVSMQ